MRIHRNRTEAPTTNRPRFPLPLVYNPLAGASHVGRPSADGRSRMRDRRQRPSLSVEDARTSRLVRGHPCVLRVDSARPTPLGGVRRGTCRSRRAGSRADRAAGTATTKSAPAPPSSAIHKITFGSPRKRLRLRRAAAARALAAIVDANLRRRARAAPGSLVRRSRFAMAIDIARSYYVFGAPHHLC